MSHVFCPCSHGIAHYLDFSANQSAKQTNCGAKGNGKNCPKKINALVRKIAQDKRFAKEPCIHNHGNPVRDGAIMSFWRVFSSTARQVDRVFCDYYGRDWQSCPPRDRLTLLSACDQKKVRKGKNEPGLGSVKRDIKLRSTLPIVSAGDHWF